MPSPTYKTKEFDTRVRRQRAPYPQGKYLCENAEGISKLTARALARLVRGYLLETCWNGVYRLKNINVSVPQNLQSDQIRISGHNI